MVIEMDLASKTNMKIIKWKLISSLYKHTKPKMNFWIERDKRLPLDARTSKDLTNVSSNGLRIILPWIEWKSPRGVYGADFCDGEEKGRCSNEKGSEK